MKIVVNAGFWKDVLELLGALLNEAQLDVSEEGLRLQMMDEPKVGLTVMELPAVNFEEIEPEGDYIRFSVSEMKNVVKRAGDDDKFIIVPAPNVLRLTIKGKRERIFGIPSLTAEDTTKRRPAFEPEMRMMVSTDGIMEALKDAEVVLGKEKKEILQYVNLKVEGLGVTFSAEKEGAFRYSKSTLLPGWDIMDIKGGEADSMYGIAYLKPLFEAVSKICGMVKMEWTTNFPLKVDCMLPFKGQLLYFMAPRIPIERQERGKEE